jgi:hypothetical protein
MSPPRGLSISAMSRNEIDTMIGKTKIRRTPFRRPLIQNEQEIAAELVSHETTSVRRSRARHAAAGHLGGRDKRTTALLISACQAHQRFLDIKPFWK